MVSALLQNGACTLLNSVLGIKESCGPKNYLMLNDLNVKDIKVSNKYWHRIRTITNKYEYSLFLSE